MDTLQTAAKTAAENGLNILWRVDTNSKRPVRENGDPRRWEKDKLTFNPNAWENISDGDTGIGIICGSTSGSLEVLDIEGAAEEMKQAFLYRATKDDLFKKLLGCVEHTPSGGIHVLYRCDEIEGGQKLARGLRFDPAKGNEVPKTLAETRGEGNFIVCAPSTDNRGGWALHEGSSWETIPTITAEERKEILDWARTFDELPEPERVVNYRAPIKLEDDGRPGTGYAISPNALNDMIDMLENVGAVVKPHLEGYYVWKNDDEHHHGTLGMSNVDGANGEPQFFCFSPNWEPFEANKAYNAYEMKAYLEFNKDFGACSAALVRQGYGDKKFTLVQSPAVLERKLNIVDNGRIKTTFTPIDREAIKPTLVMGGRLPLGYTSHWFGKGGIGKSYAWLEIVGRVMSGRPLPGDEDVYLEGDALIFAFEDMDDTIGHRLDIMGVDKNPLRPYRGEDKGLGPDEVVHILKDVEADPSLDVKIIVIDPVEEWFADWANAPTQSPMNDGRAIRFAMRPLNEWAMRNNGLVILVNHTNSREGTTARTRILGSKAWANAGRSSYMFGEYEPNKTCMAVDKLNVGAPPTGIAYEIDHQGFHWGEELDGITAEHIAAFKPEGVANADPNDIYDWLYTLVSDWPVVSNGDKISDALIEENRERRKLPKERTKTAKFLMRDEGIIRFAPGEDNPRRYEIAVDYEQFARWKEMMDR
jgi:hypothetical protein